MKAFGLELDVEPKKGRYALSSGEAMRAVLASSAELEVVIRGVPGRVLANGFSGDPDEHGGILAAYVVGRAAQYKGALFRYALSGRLIIVGPQHHAPITVNPRRHRLEDYVDWAWIYDLAEDRRRKTLLDDLPDPASGDGVAAESARTCRADYLRTLDAFDFDIAVGELGDLTRGRQVVEYVRVRAAWLAERVANAERARRWVA